MEDPIANGYLNDRHLMIACLTERAFFLEALSAYSHSLLVWCAVTYAECDSVSNASILWGLAGSDLIQTSNEGGKSFLSKNTELLFVFSPLDPTKLLEDQKLVAWKTLGVTRGSHQVNRIDYTGRVGISVLSKQEGNTVYGGQDQEFKLGEKRDVTGDRDAYEWSAASAIDPNTPSGQGLMQAYNKTNSTLALYVGLYKPDSKTEPEPALLFEQISVDSAATVELTPMLRVYSTAEYKATQILRGAIQGFLGEWNLAKIRGPNEGEGLTRFTLWEDANNGNKLHLDSDMDKVPGVRTAS